MNYMSMGIGRHCIIRRDITTKLYIMHYGYVIEVIVTSPPIGGGRGIVMPMSVCLFVCVFVRVFAKFQSVISQSFLNRSS